MGAAGEGSPARRGAAGASGSPFRGEDRGYPGRDGRQAANPSPREGRSPIALRTVAAAAARKRRMARSGGCAASAIHRPRDRIKGLPWSVSIAPPSAGRGTDCPRRGGPDVRQGLKPEGGDATRLRSRKPGPKGGRRSRRTRDLCHAAEQSYLVAWSANSQRCGSCELAQGAICVRAAQTSLHPGLLLEAVDKPS